MEEGQEKGLRWSAQEAAGAGGVGDAGAAEWGVGWRKAGAGLWVGPGPAEQTSWFLKSQGMDQVSQPLRPQRWPGQPPG